MEYGVIPNMLDTSFEVPERDDGDTERTRLLYVGYLRDSKGVRYLVDAMEHLPSSFELTIVGGGPEYDTLRKRAAGSSAADRIELTGNVPYEEVTQAYTKADVFVHPGVWPEPFGRTILEAMQAGLPIVATELGGPSETVPQEDLLCKPGDPAGLAECIERANEERERIGADNKRLVKKRYHPDAVVPQFREVYDRVRSD
jgi:glycosyltransferase involved in cell wall biosynthesis